MKLALAVCSLVLSAAAAAAPLPRAKSPESVGFSAARLQRLTDAFNADVERGAIPGAVVMIVRDGQVAYAQAFGYRDRAAKAPMQMDSVFRIASMTKPITMVAALQLVEEGKLQLMHPAARYLPQLANMQVAKEQRDAAGEVKLVLEPARRQMTVQDLMRHTAGFTYGPLGDSLLQRQYRAANAMDEQQTNAEMVDKLAKLPLAGHPGEIFEYGMSNDVVGRIVEVISGMDFNRYVAERVAKPLSMKDTTFVLDAQQAARRAMPQPQPGAKAPILAPYDPARPPKWFSGGGGLNSTAEDYVRFCLMLINGGVLDGERILSRKSVELMASNHLPPNVTYGDYAREMGLTAPLPELGQGYGLGVGVRMEPGRAVVPGSVGDFYWAGATGPYFWIDPQEKLIAVMMLQESDLERRTHYRSVLRNLVYQALQ